MRSLEDRLETLNETALKGICNLLDNELKNLRRLKLCDPIEEDRVEIARQEAAIQYIKDRFSGNEIRLF